MIFLLFLTFLLQQTSAECPLEKIVGDTCYTLVEYTDTAQEYGCFEGCAYKKTEDEEGGQLYCFKRGSLPVSDSNCAAPDYTGYSEDFETIKSVEEPVTITNLFDASSVIVNSWCYTLKTLIPNNANWTGGCNVKKIKGHYDYFDEKGKKETQDCTPLLNSNLPISKFIISNDSIPGDCRITLPIGASNTNMAIDTSSDTQNGEGMITIKNEFTVPLNVRVIFYPQKRVNIQPEQTIVRRVLVKSIVASYKAGGTTTKCTYKTGTTPPTFHSTFVILPTSGPDCEITTPTPTE